MTKSLYQHDKACVEFVKYIGESLQANILEKVRKSRFFGLMVDETTKYIADKKSLIIYVSYIERFNPITSYLCLISLENENAEAIFGVIMEVVRESNLDIEKFIGFGSDGAGVMIGSVTGVVTRLKKSCPFLSSIHCIAHRCNLACSGPASKLAYSNHIDALVNATVAFFSNSCKRQFLLHTLQEELANDVLKLSRINTMRWLSRHGSIKFICDVLQAVIHCIKAEFDKLSNKQTCSQKDVIFLDEDDQDVGEGEPEAALASISKSKKAIQAAAAKKLLTRLCDFKTIYNLQFLADFGKMSILSLIFQRDYVEVGAISRIVSSEIAMIQLESIEDPPTNLNAGMYDGKRYPILPDYGPENGYLQKLQSCIRGNMYYDIEISRSVVGDDLEEAIDFQKSFSCAIVKSLSKQFQDRDHLSCFKALSPSNIPKCMREMKDYGYKEINHLVDFYWVSRVDATGALIPPLIAIEEVRKEYKAYKIQAITEWSGRSFRDTSAIIGCNEQLTEKYKGLIVLHCACAMCEFGCLRKGFQ
ncbi:hypothetical protein O6H91_08G093900 [Diphasiastrum complanatum]|uniref:Uncharacterized protein n=1 Tax=Diphasiastrum complanatum TaxID=34168 RepID=A0ACC2D032_DIPCM|nr:hypothetical protein O6H91_08G093900 [Diphasiastrum complanatum]